jgi:hypothetical protein
MVFVWNTSLKIPLEMRFRCTEKEPAEIHTSEFSENDNSFCVFRSNRGGI